MENCPDCGAHLSGGWIQRTREVIELPVVPAQVSRSTLLGPRPADGLQAWAAWSWVNASASPLSLIATLREGDPTPVVAPSALAGGHPSTAQRAQPAVAS